MIVSDNTIQAECLRDFFKCLGEKDKLLQKRKPKGFEKSRMSFGLFVANIRPAFASRTLNQLYQQ